MSDKTHVEHNESASNLIADIPGDMDFRCYGPFADMTAAHRGRARRPLLPVSGGWRNDPLSEHICPCFVVVQPSGELQYREPPQICQLID